MLRWGERCPHRTKTNRFPSHREKLSSLEKELNDRCFTIASLNDQTLHLTRKVRAHERELDSAKAEIIRLGVHIEDLRSSRGAGKETLLASFALNVCGRGGVAF